MTLWIMCGVPGSGKTYFAKRKMVEGIGWKYISRDEIRYHFVSENEEYFSKEDQVFKGYIKAIINALNTDGIINVIADATHLNWPSRRKLLNALNNNIKNINIIPIVVSTDLLTAIKRNDEREGRECVPRDVLKRMYAQMTDPKTDPYKYTAIMYVDNEDDTYIEKKKVLYNK